MFRRTTPPDPTEIRQQAATENVRSELVVLSTQVALLMREFDALLRDTSWRLKESDDSGGAGSTP